MVPNSIRKKKGKHDLHGKAPKPKLLLTIKNINTSANNTQIIIKSLYLKKRDVIML